MSPALAVLFLGFALGMRHATDADHVAAVATIVSREQSVRASGLVGVVWGVGHTITIVLVGGAIILFGVVIPPRLGLTLELAVAVMLLVLGVTNLAPMTRVDPVACGPRPRTVAVPPLLLARSLVVGVVHGLAGSAAVALLVLATIPGPRWALVYLFVFGGGTVAGMMLLTSLIAVPFALVRGAEQGRDGVVSVARARERLSQVNRLLVRASSLVSIGLGIWLVYKIGIADGLFSGTPRWTPG